MPLQPVVVAGPEKAYASHRFWPEKGVLCGRIIIKNECVVTDFRVNKESKAFVPVDSQTCCRVVVESVQNVRTQLSQIFMQIFALQLDT